MRHKIAIDPRTDALLDVDIMKTFMPGGGLPVLFGDLVIPVAKRLHLIFRKARRYAANDRHVRGHISLASSYVGVEPYKTVLTSEGPLPDLAPHAMFTPAQLRDYLEKVKHQVLWPDHALDGTEERELHPELPAEAYCFVQVKGMDPACDSYSAFNDNLGRSTGLADRMRADGVRTLFVEGLAFDFCAGWSAIDAANAGFEVFFVLDGCRAVNMPGTEFVSGSVEKRMHDLLEAGVQIIHSRDIVAG